MRKTLMRTMGIVGICLMILCDLPAAGYCAESTPMVGVLPFEVLSQEDLSFLGKGVARMICSRIGDTGEIRVQCSILGIKGSGNDMGPEALKRLRETTEFQAMDYLVRGTITVAGGTLSTDVELIDIVKGETRASFHESGAGQQDVLRHASAISSNIKNTLLGRPVLFSPDQTSTGSGLSGTLFAPDQVPASTLPQNSGKPQPSGVPARPSSGPVQVFKSRSFDTEFRGLAAGDIDGDGINELVAVDEHTLMVFAVERGALSQKSALKGNYYDFIKGVDVADINDNGKAEIFVSVTGRSGDARSFVVEWEGQGFRTLVPRSDTYYRVQEIDGKNRLFGQHGSHNDFFAGPVQALEWDGSGYREAGVAPLSSGTTVFDFSVGNFLSSGSREVLELDRKGYLSVTDTEGRTIWISDDPLCLTPFYIEKGSSRHYLSNRILIVPGDAAAGGLVIVSDNHDMSRGYIGRFRKFTKSAVKAFSWNGTTLEPAWQTADIRGYVSDLTLKDLDSDGRPELIYAVGQESGKLIQTTRSHVVIEKF